LSRGANSWPELLGNSVRLGRHFMEAERPAGDLHGDLRDVHGSSRGELLRGLEEHISSALRRAASRNISGSSRPRPWLFRITRLTRWAFSSASLLNSPSSFARSFHMSWTYRVLAHRRAIAAMASFSFARKK
jgi:hypothetical protein